MCVNPKINGIVMQCLRKVSNDIIINSCIKVRYTADDVPSTGKAIHAMWKQAKQGKSDFRVFNGAQDPDKLYFSVAVNQLYRFVHDVDHALAYELGRGTTKYEDELYLNCLMAKRVYDWCIKDGDYSTQDALLAFFSVYHDTVGQAKYYKEHKEFCVDQRANTVKLINECRGVWAAIRGLERMAYAVMLGYMHECGL